MKMYRVVSWGFGGFLNPFAHRSTANQSGDAVPGCTRTTPHLRIALPVFKYKNAYSSSISGLCMPVGELGFFDNI